MRLGGVESLRDQHREIRSLPFFETLFQDLRYASRTLRRDAGFTAFAILIVGLGIGAAPPSSASSTHCCSARSRSAIPAASCGLQYPGRCRRRRVANPGRALPRSAQAREVPSPVSRAATALRTGDVKLTGAGEPERLTGVPVARKLFLRPRHPPAPRQIVQRRRMQVERPAGRHVEPQLLAAPLRLRPLHRGPKAHPQRRARHRRRCPTRFLRFPQSSRQARASISTFPSRSPRKPTAGATPSRSSAD